MQYTNVRLLIFLLWVPAMYCCEPAEKIDQNVRPNIMIIMADDMGYADIGCYGSEVHTPNLDQLAVNGLRFTQFYNTSRCCPTRASLLTGLYPHQTGVGHMVADLGTDAYRGDLNNHCVTIAEVLKEAGYATYMSGKWHITKQVGLWSGIDSLTSQHNWPMQRGFEKFYGTIAGAASYFDPITLTHGNTPIKPEAENFYYTDQISANAVRYINEHQNANDDKPFFCYVAYTAPHWPLHALPVDIKRYQGRYDIGWDSLRKERLIRMGEMGIIDTAWALSERDERVQPWHEVENKDWQKRRMEVYAAQIDRMDQGIGQIIQALEKNGQLNNTLIFFLADNGGCAEEISGEWKSLSIPDSTRNGEPVVAGNKHQALMPGPENTYQSYGIPWANASNTPFRLYKHYVHEGGISTPLIVHWPLKIQAKNEFRQQPSHVIDIMATCVDISQAKYPENFKGIPVYAMEGKSLLPAFDDKPIEREALFWEHEGNSAVRMGKWKLVRKHNGGWELFDMEKDRSETLNLANEYPEQVNELKEKYQDWARRVGVQPWPVKL